MRQKPLAKEAFSERKIYEKTITVFTEFNCKNRGSRGSDGVGGRSDYELCR